MGTQEGRCLLRREPILRNVRHPVHDGELSKDRAQARLQATDDRAAILCRHTVERLGNGTGNGGESIAVTADGDGVADAVLEVGAFEEGFDRIGDRPGTGGSEVIEDVVRPDLVKGEANLVILLNVCLDLVLRGSVQRKVHRSRRGLSTGNAIGVIVRGLGGQAGQALTLFERAGKPSHGRDTHRASVATAVVGLRARCFKPPAKCTTITGVWITPPELLHPTDRGRRQIRHVTRAVRAPINDRLRHRKRHHRSQHH